MREELQPAFILHVQPYRNTSALVDFLTLDYGRVSGVVKGVYRQSKTMQKMRGQLQPGFPLLISWFGKSDLKTITKLEQYGQAVNLVQAKLFSVLYINELLVRLLRNFDAHPLIYESYQQTLKALSGDIHVEIPLRKFEFTLLQEVGYGIDFRYDALSGLAIDLDQTYLFVEQSGFFPIDADAPDVDQHSVITGQQIIALGNFDFDDLQLRRLAKRITRLALQPHLGGKPLRSRELFGYKRKGKLR